MMVAVNWLNCSNLQHRIDVRNPKGVNVDFITYNIWESSFGKGRFTLVILGRNKIS